MPCVCLPYSYATGRQGGEATRTREINFTHVFICRDKAPTTTRRGLAYPGLRSLPAGRCHPLLNRPGEPIPSLSARQINCSPGYWEERSRCFAPPAVLLITKAVARIFVREGFDLPLPFLPSPQTFRRGFEVLNPLTYPLNMALLITFSCGAFLSASLRYDVRLKTERKLRGV